MTDKRIVSSAIRFGTLVTSLASGRGRHHEIIFRHHSTAVLPEHEQGFLTNEGMFVGRKEALKIAMAAKQVKKKTGNPSELFSEDLW